MLGENVQNQTGPVEKLGTLTKGLFKVSQLARGKLIIKDDHIAVQVLTQLNQLFDLARADQSGSLEALQSLPSLSCNLEAGCAR
jgi:hypothetical protein